MAFSPQNPIPNEVDPHIWKACAGSSVKIPTVDSRVYYFPQGHAEQSSSSPDFSSLPILKPFYLCRIAAVRLLANPDTDEVFAKIRLEPLSAGKAGRPAILCPESATGEKVVSFAKILTPSDANNGGGFSVPRFCAESIFPPLNFNANPPVQTISIRDVHGTVWCFRHIYRGTPRRHLLTTGWSKFVNQKKLVAGDSVLFIKHKGRGGELFMGVRRARSSCVGRDYGRWTELGKVGGEGEEGGSWRSRKGKVWAESVVEAARLAGAGRAFEIVYYPNAGSPDFVVRAEAVEAAMRVYWSVGLRVKMAIETEDSSRMTWFQGTVSSTAGSDVGIWRGSPWRLLQVTWDEPEVLQKVKRVNPWEVEVVSASPHMQTPFPSPKRIKLSHDPELLTEGEGPMFFPMMGLSQTVIGNMNPSLFNYNSYPVGMQGARHNQIWVPSLPNFIHNNHGLLYSDILFGNNIAPELSPISTELHIGNTSQSDNSSPPIQGTIHIFGTQLNANQVCEPTKQTGGSSIQLFGQIIQTKQHVEADVENGGCVDDDSKGCKKTEGGPLDYSPSHPYKQLFNQLDPQLQRVSLVGGSL